jgi:hypothetical protein
LGLAVALAAAALLAAPHTATAAVAGTAAADGSGITLPHTTTVLADGTRVSTADPAAIQRLTAASNPGCGWACDNQPPDAYWRSDDGHTFYLCMWDAVTVASAWQPYHPGYRYHVDLRYSPRCRTAWAYGDSGAVAVDSYWGNGSYRTSYVWWDPYIHPVFSNMANDANLLARACFGFPDADPWSEGCTRRY